MVIQIKEHETVEELKKNIRESVDGWYQLRLRTILLAREGNLKNNAYFVSVLFKLKKVKYVLDNFPKYYLIKIKVKHQVA